MTQTQLSKNIIRFEMLGFLIVIAMLWLNEVLDLPHRLLGAPATPINFVESIIETIIVLVLAVIVILLTRFLLKKILKGILPVCIFCKNIREDDQWISIDSYIRDHSEIDFSHSLCPQCYLKHYGDILHLDENKEQEEV